LPSNDGVTNIQPFNKDWQAGHSCLFKLREKHNHAVMDYIPDSLLM